MIQQMFSQIIMDEINKGNINGAMTLFDFHDSKEKLDPDFFYQLLMVVHRKGHAPFAKMLLNLPNAQNLTSENYFDLLRCAVVNGTPQLLEQLLAVPIAQSVAQNQENMLLKNAVFLGHADQVAALLALPNVIMTINNLSYDDISNAIDNNHTEVALLLLDLAPTRAMADRNNNEMLCHAVQNNNVRVVEKLLTISAVANKMYLNNFQVLHWAITNGHLSLLKQMCSMPVVNQNVEPMYLFMTAKLARKPEVMKLLVTCPWVQSKLMQDQGVRLQWLVNFFNNELSFVLDDMMIYGMPYSKLKQLITAAQLKSYLVNPVAILQQHNMPVDVIEAISINASECRTDDYRRQQANEARARESHFNVDDEKRIGAVKSHFQTVIKPHFKAKFEQYGSNDEERLVNIEQSIRTFLLDCIKQEATENGTDPKSAAVLSYINSIEPETKIKLLQGTDVTLMDEARSIFSSTQSEAQTAWRAYDAWAPVKGDWPNLLTAPLAESNKKLFTVAAVGLEAPTTKMASDLSREMAAYSFLLVCDPEDGDKSTLATRQQNFIAKIAEIRRAHNEDPTQMDDPSCLPGTVSRAGDMWLAHAKAVMIKEEELIAEELRSIVLSEFQTLEKNHQKEVYHALVMLSHCNAEEIIGGKATMSANDLQLRYQFKRRFQDMDAIYTRVSGLLQARGANPINLFNFLTFASNMIIDIGGSWIAPQLTALYLKTHKEPLQNPYRFFIETQVTNISMQKAIILLRKIFAEIELADKNSLVMKTAKLIAEDKLDQAIIDLITQGIASNIITEITTSLSNHMLEQFQVAQQKAKLWDKLYSQLEDAPIPNQDEMLREMVNKVIDEKQSLESVLAEKQLRMSNTLLTQYNQQEAQPLRNSKRKQELTSSSDEKRVRFE